MSVLICAMATACASKVVVHAMISTRVLTVDLMRARMSALGTVFARELLGSVNASVLHRTVAATARRLRAQRVVTSMAFVMVTASAYAMFMSKKEADSMDLHVRMQLVILVAAVMEHVIIKMGYVGAIESGKGPAVNFLYAQVLVQDMGSVIQGLRDVHATTNTQANESLTSTKGLKIPDRTVLSRLVHGLAV